MNEKTFSDRLDSDNAKLNFNFKQLAMIYDGLIGDAKKCNKLEKLEKTPYILPQFFTFPK